MAQNVCRFVQQRGQQNLDEPYHIQFVHQQPSYIKEFQWNPALCLLDGFSWLYKSSAVSLVDQGKGRVCVCVFWSGEGGR